MRHFTAVVANSFSDDFENVHRLRQWCVCVCPLYNWEFPTLADAINMQYDVRVRTVAADQYKCRSFTFKSIYNRLAKSYIRPMPINMHRFGNDWNFPTVCVPARLHAFGTRVFLICAIAMVNFGNSTRFTDVIFVE